MHAPFGMTRNYYLLLCGYFTSSIGDWLYRLALPLLVYEITHSAFSMAVTFGLTYLPYILFLPIGGVIADRVDRRRLLIIGDLISAVVAGLLALAVWQGLRSMWIIYPAVFILAGVTPLYHPAFQSVVPKTVDDRHLARANAWIQGSENIVALVGPLIGGLFIVALGATTAMFLNALSFLMSALLIATIRLQSTHDLRVTEAQSSIIADLREGLAFVWNHSVIRWGSVLFIGFNFAFGLVQGNYVYFLTDLLKLNPTELGIGFAIPGLGAIIGALVAPMLARRLQVGQLILGGFVIAGLMMLPLLTARSLFAVAVPWAIVMAIGAVIAVTWFTLRQRVVPPYLLGRVVALTRLIPFIPIPIGAMIGGILLNNTQSMSPLIGVAATVVIATGILGRFTPLYRDGKELPNESIVDSAEVAAVK